MGQDDEDDAFMLQAKQQITKNVINKRKDQLRRWQVSEMNAEPARREKRPKVQFQDSDVFLSACMSGDESEVEDLLDKGADINTCTVDGLTALHQSVIDSKPEMVRFLCEKGADVNAQDNEGWTPLHAAACCGNVAIVRYLCQNGADLTIVNSDKELPLDLAEDEQCRDYLEQDYRGKSIDINACRDQEMDVMLRDAKKWLQTGEYNDVPHHRTGGTAMHVAAARGYTQILEMLIKAGGNVNARDKDDWTPLHAAAHWAERDACKILIENGASLNAQTSAKQDVLSIADKEVVDYLIELAEAFRNRDKKKSTSPSVLQEKNHRVGHDEHIMTTEKKKEIQHRDQHSENEFMVNESTIEVGASAEPTVANDVETTPEDEDVEEEDEEEEKNAMVVDEASEVEDKRMSVESSSTPSSELASRSSDAYSRSSVDRETSSEAMTDSSKTSTTATSASSASTTSLPYKYGSSSPSASGSQSRSVSMPPTTSSAAETPRSSLETTSMTTSSSMGSGDQNVSATIPIAPTSAPPKALHQSPSSWINRGFPLVSRQMSSTTSRSVTPSEPASSSSAPSTPSAMAATISSMAKNSSPTGSVTITANFTKPSSKPPQPQSSTNVPWASLWQSNNSAMSGQQIRTQIAQFKNAAASSSSSALIGGGVGRLSAFRAPVKTSASASTVIAEYPRGFVPHQIDPSKISRWQTKPVTESEAERRNNSRMQRQHRRSTQGVTKEQLEEATRLVSEETAARRNSRSSMNGGRTMIRLASEEKDLSETSEPKDGDVTMTATMSLSSQAANVRRKSQGLTISRSNRRATGPVNPEDLAQLRSNDDKPSSTAGSTAAATSTTTSSTSTMSSGTSSGLRLAAAAPSRASTQHYSPVSVRSVTGTVPTMTSRFAEKAHSLPPTSAAGSGSSSANGTSPQPISNRSAVVAAGLTRSSATTTQRYAPTTSSASSTASSNNSTTHHTNSFSLQNRPVEMNLNYKALYEKERNECERLRKEMDEMRRSSTSENWRHSNASTNWRARNASPSSQQQQGLTVSKSTSLASFDDNERRNLERKIADLETQLKATMTLRMENQRLKEENGALVRVISKMTI